MNVLNRINTDSIYHIEKGEGVTYALIRAILNLEDASKNEVEKAFRNLSKDTKRELLSLSEKIIVKDNAFSIPGKSTKGNSDFLVINKGEGVFHAIIRSWLGGTYAKGFTTKEIENIFLSLDSEIKSKLKEKISELTEKYPNPKPGQVIKMDKNFLEDINITNSTKNTAPETTENSTQGETNKSPQKNTEDKILTETLETENLENNNKADSELQKIQKNFDQQIKESSGKKIKIKNLQELFYLLNLNTETKNSIKNLSLSGEAATHITSTTNIRTHFPNLITLTIYNSGISISNIAKIKNLQNLNINGIKNLTEISDLGNLEKLTYLDISKNTSLQNINGLEKLSNLKELEIDQQHINTENWKFFRHIEKINGQNIISIRNTLLSIKDFENEVKQIAQKLDFKGIWNAEKVAENKFVKALTDAYSTGKITSLPTQNQIEYAIFSHTNDNKNIDFGTNDNKNIELIENIIKELNNKDF